MSIVYQDTRFGRMWVDPTAPHKVQNTNTTVFAFNSSTDIPATAFTSDTIFKYYSADSQMTVPYVDLKFDLQVSPNGSDWTSVKSFAREIGKDTLSPTYDVPVQGIQGTFTFPIYPVNYYQVVMRSVGGDSTGYFNMVIGISSDHVFRDTPVAGNPASGNGYDGRN